MTKKGRLKRPIFYFIHSLTFAAYYDIIVVTTQLWPWQMWHCAVGTTPMVKIMWRFSFSIAFALGIVDVA